MNRAWVFGRDEAEFIVDAFERDGAPQWMACAADVRKLFGMAPYPAGSVRLPTEPRRVSVDLKAFSTDVDELMRKHGFTPMGGSEV